MLSTQIDGLNGYPDERQIRKPFTLKQQIHRVAWWIGNALLFKLSLRPMYTWRRWVLRLYGANLDANACIQRTARIECPWNLKMGRYSTIGERVWVYNLAPITIGDFSTISPRVFLCTGSHDYRKPELPLLTAPIVIGKGVWLAADVFVGPNVKIGDYAVVLARSVVVKNMPPETVCAGHPCKPIKPRLP